MTRFLTFCLALASCHCPAPTPPVASYPAEEPTPTSGSVGVPDNSLGDGKDESVEDDAPAPREVRLAPPRNVVFLIGDGMGPVHEEAASLFLHGSRDELRMHGASARTMITTHSADALITDSAASASAFATGRKVNYEVVSLDPVTAEPLTTVVEELHQAGFRTGLVTTSRISHATPAAFAAHAASRYDEREIWMQMLETGPTLLFGGGTPGLTAQRLSDAGYAVSDSADEMLALDPSVDRWSMIYGRDHIPYVLDGLGDAPSLPLMTSQALRLLEGAERGFFLMIEGARIDHAAHNNDFERMIPEVLAFDEALTVVLQWASERDDTLVLLTADHECGGLSILDEARQGQLARVEWSTTGHTGVLVNLYAWGLHASEVSALRDNTEVHRLLRWPVERHQPEGHTRHH